MSVVTLRILPLLALAAWVTVACDTGDEPSAALVDVAGAERSPGAAAAPPTWVGQMEGPRDGEAWQIACLDENGDGVIDTSDGDEFSGLSIALTRDACDGPARTPEYYAGLAGEAATTCGSRPPALFVVIGGGGTQLQDTTSGVSYGLLQMRNALYGLLERAGVASSTIITASAISGAEQPQTQMERWLQVQLERRLDETPCLRAVLFGHSHGGVTVTSVMSALEARFPGRMYGVALDRSIALYDRAARELPDSAPLLNVYQLNEGWHGVPIEQPNVVNVDQSRQTAPVEPRKGLEPVGPVTHTNLDDSLPVQTDIVERVLEWALR